MAVCLAFPSNRAALITAPPPDGVILCNKRMNYGSRRFFVHAGELIRKIGSPDGRQRQRIAKRQMRGFMEIHSPSRVEIYNYPRDWNFSQ